MHAIDIDSITVQYQNTTIINGLTLRVKCGEVYALLGANGAGKTTTLNSIMGLTSLVAGNINVAGVNVANNPITARKNIAFVPENVALYPHLSGAENFEYFMRLSGHNADQNTRAEAFNTVGLPANAAEQRVSAYSKGMRQKVALAIAISRKAPVLLMDEPTSGLDPKATAEFHALLSTLKQQDTAILMVTHDIIGAIACADKVGCLTQGGIQEFSQTADLQLADLIPYFQHGGMTQINAGATETP